MAKQNYFRLNETFDGWQFYVFSTLPDDGSGWFSRPFPGKRQCYDYACERGYIPHSAWSNR